MKAPREAQHAQQPLTGTFLAEFDASLRSARETHDRNEARLAELEARDAALSEPLECVGCGEQFTPRAGATDPDLCGICGIDYLSWLEREAEADAERQGTAIYPTPCAFGEPL